MNNTIYSEQVNVEKKLLSLINSTRILTSTRDLNLVLERIIEEAIQVIEPATIGVLFLYDAKSRALIPKSNVGFDHEFMRSIVLAENEGMTGKTFSAKKATIFSHIKDTHLAMSDLSSENHDLYFKALGVLKYPVSTICAPLLSYGECIGVLTIDSYSDDVNFTENELMLLETFANQAVIAIENARLFSQNERATKVYTELSKVSLSKKGLQEFTSSLSSLINQKIGIFNEFFDVVSSCSDAAQSLAVVLNQTNPISLKKAFRRNAYSHECLNLNGVEIEVFYFPIKSDFINIGLLTIFANKEGLDPLDIFAIEQAMILFGLEMVAQEKTLTNRFKYEGYVLEQLLNNHESVADNQNYFSEKDLYIFVKLEIQISQLPLDQIAVRIQKFGRLLLQELSYFDFKSLVLEKNNQYHLLFIIKNRPSEYEIIKKIKVFFNHLDRKSQEANILEMVVGIGRMFNELRNIQMSLYDSDKCIDYLKLGAGGKNIFSYDELGVHRLLLNVNRLDLKYYVQDKLGGILEYDRKNNSELLQTLKAFLDRNQNLKETAEQCYVHLNTVKYRLQTIKKILNVKSISGESFFELQLAIYAHNFYLK